MEIRVDPEKIQKLVKEIFKAAGLKDDEAFTVSENLVQAEMRGIRSHGLVQVANYVNLIRSKKINADAKITLLREGPANLVFDAQNAPGSVAVKFAMEKTIEKAKKSGVAVTTVKNGTHFGFAAYYAMQALKENMIGFAFTSTGKAVAPFGGFEKMLGTNPICVAVPAGEKRPVIFDAATSNVAYNKIFFAYTEGRSIPDNWGLTTNGSPTTNPADIIEKGGALLPFGSYKGYGLGFIVYIITSLLAGVDVSEESGETAGENYMQVAFNFAAIDISRFTEPETFKKNLDISIARLKASKTAPGISEILIPGEIEFKNYEKAQKEGLVLYEGVSSILRKSLEELGLPGHLEDCIIK